MGSGKRNSEVYPDIKKNRLYITVSGYVTKKEMEKIYTDIRFSVPDLQPGFAVVTDLTQCRISHLNALPIFKNIMMYLASNKVGRIIRIVGAAKIIFKQLARITTPSEEYRPIYVATREEAEEKLSEPL